MPEREAASVVFPEQLTPMTAILCILANLNPNITIYMLLISSL